MKFIRVFFMTRGSREFLWSCLQIISIYILKTIFSNRGGDSFVRTVSLRNFLPRVFQIEGVILSNQFHETISVTNVLKGSQRFPPSTQTSSHYSFQGTEPITTSVTTLMKISTARSLVLPGRAVARSAAFFSVQANSKLCTFGLYHRIIPYHSK